MFITKIVLKTIIVFLIMNEILLSQDWANLNRFKNENDSVNINLDEDRIVFMGNSITQGWIEQRPEFFDGKPFINRGISGQTTPQMLLRFRQDVINLKPKVVVILAGTNDIAGNTGPSTLEMILDNLKSMSEIAKANGIKVILSSVVPAFDYPWKSGMYPNEKIPQLNKMIKKYCDENDVIYLDYFSAMTDERNGLPEKFSADGVHPNADGYKIMEPLVEAAIKKALE
ncbi:MAG: SGNH/GDSL hydrolase family protein [Ignavibacteriae bacterium]|nr:SGNH/GDSL hydrolase family protein [Ignavibacteriota bacterium]